MRLSWLAGVGGALVAGALGVDLGGGVSAAPLLAMDIDGDGRTDLVQPLRAGDQARVEVWLSDGVGFRHAWSGTVGVWSRETRELAVDLDGDGASELVRRVRVGDRAWADVWRWSGERLDLVSSSALGPWGGDPAAVG
jgi:hypothetical protein